MTTDIARLTSLGSQLGDYVQRQNGRPPSLAALQGVVADLAVSQPDLQAPLRDLVSRQSFAALLPHARSGSGLIQRDALIQEISRVYHPDMLVRVEQVLNGFLDASGGIATSLTQEQAIQSEKPISLAPDSPVAHGTEPKAATSQVHSSSTKSHQSSSSIKQVGILLAIGLCGVPALVAMVGFIGSTVLNQASSCSAIDAKLEPLASDSPEFKKLINENKEACAEDARFLVQQAILVSDQGDHRKSLQLIQKSLKIYPDNPAAYLQMGTAYFGLKDYNNSLPAFDRAVELDPKNSVAAYLKAATLSWLNRSNESISWFSKSIELNPANSLGYRERGRERALILNPPQYQAGLADLDKAIKIDNGDAQSYSIRAYIKTWLDDFAGACRDIKKAKQLGLSQVTESSGTVPIGSKIQEICN